MSIEQNVIENIVKHVIKGQDYRQEVVALIDAQFLDLSVKFFQKVVEAKLKEEEIGLNWYKESLLSEDLPTREIAYNAGLNMKTIRNSYGSASRPTVIEASLDHYEKLGELVNTLVEENKDLNIELTIKFKGVSVELNLNETLIVINTLAVYRAALRGGLWSEAGKKAEKPLMKALCELYQVPKEYYHELSDDADREVDFHFKNIDDENTLIKCEVKLMGGGNPESADAIYARGTRLFVADTLSELNTTQADEKGIHWIALRTSGGYKKLAQCFTALKIPFTPLAADIDEKLSEKLEEIVPKVF